MAAAIVELKCITNLHVGNGDVNYNIIDNEVERDPVTEYPTINSSGVKGSLRQFFKDSGVNDELIKTFFGSDTKDGTIFPGQVKILGADMLAIPGRASAGDQAYYLMTTPTMLKHYEEIYNTFLGKAPEKSTSDPGKEEIEGEKPTKKIIVGGHTLYSIPDNVFRHISLPVMARNKLDDGKSTNLWYEEVVPHESLFYFAVISEKKDILKNFTDQINGKIIQFGANATIGYGLCKAEVHTKV